MARLLLLFLAAYGIWCTSATESANLSVTEMSGAEYESATGLFKVSLIRISSSNPRDVQRLKSPCSLFFFVHYLQEHVSNDQNERQFTESSLTGERNVNMHRKIVEFYLDYADPQPNKDHASSAPHVPPPVKHA
ncbi:uncharacterized protein LOC131077140 isoform X1 [Cryptomeria japonica]|uniref:uncharacterized protein LOC131077140 isoform X1 n=1 Tax=Cryptomeria japonica TaxID=3369 RepID=UPI0025AC8660|nr:uncharacterized protein LOC131077140 isoform X1 [Cryptomeria japonica]